MQENTFYFRKSQEETGLRVQFGGVFNRDVIPVLLEMAETHILEGLLKYETFSPTYSEITKSMYEEKERLEIVLDKINTMGEIDEEDGKPHIIDISTPEAKQYVLVSLLHPNNTGKVFWAFDFKPTEYTDGVVSAKLSDTLDSLIADVRNLGYNPTEADKEIL